MLVSKDPKRVDPVMKLTDDVIVCTTSVCAVNVPLTVKLSALDAVDAKEALVDVVANDALTAFKTYDAVVANDALTAFATNDAVVAFDAQLAVPNRDPVIPLVTFREPVITELLSAMTPLRATNS